MIDCRNRQNSTRSDYYSMNHDSIEKENKELITDKNMVGVSVDTWPHVLVFFFFFWKKHLTMKKKKPLQR